MNEKRLQNVILYVNCCCRRSLKSSFCASCLHPVKPCCWFELLASNKVTYKASHLKPSVIKLLFKQAICKEYFTQQQPQDFSPPTAITLSESDELVAGQMVEEKPWVLLCCALRWSQWQQQFYLQYIARFITHKNNVLKSMLANDAIKQRQQK